MISFEQITKGYFGDDILENVNFRINPGEKCGLVGRNGSGKSTLLRMIVGEEHPDQGLIELPRNYRLGHLTQHLNFTQLTPLEEVVYYLPEDKKDCVYKAEKILFGLGFKQEEVHSPIASFSGGYQLRIHLAKVLIQEPDCLLLDEPTNYLDIVSIRWFTRFLKAWTGELILISHDREFMDSVTTHTLGIHRKKVLKIEGSTESFYSKILQEEENYEKTRLNLEKKKAHMEAFITKLGAKATKAAQAESRKKALAKMPVLEELAAIHNLNFSFPYSPFPGRLLMELEEISFSYEGKENLIEKFSLSVEKGDRIAIVGKNGRGKSTLLRLIARDLEHRQGKMRIPGNVRIGFFGQTNIDRLSLHLTIEEEIAFAAPHLNIEEVRRICGAMLFPGEKAKKTINTLSGGEKSRVLLGKILATPCNLLLLDEPTNHLDMESIAALAEAIENFEGTVIFVTHSEMLLKQLATTFVVCRSNEQLLFRGSYEEFLEKIGWENPEAGKGEKNASERKESRRRRADIVNKRAATLKPLERKIQKLEAEITTLEEQNAKKIDELIEISTQQGNKNFASLSKEIEERKKEIEAKFEVLAQLTHEFELQQNAFEKLLSSETSFKDE